MRWGLVLPRNTAGFLNSPSHFEDDLCTPVSHRAAEGFLQCQEKLAAVAIVAGKQEEHCLSPLHSGCYGERADGPGSRDKAHR